jgi:hypothetical protein
LESEVARLSDYMTDTQSILRDYSGMFNAEAQLVRWINEARRQCAQRTGCVRRLVSGQSAFGASAQPNFAIPGAMQPGALPGATPAGTVAGAASNSLQTIPGVERYPFQGFFNPYAQAQYAGIEGIIDVNNLSVNWGGAVRPSLAWMAWEDLQAYARAYATLVTSYPYYWSVMDDGENGEIWMFPAPSTTGDIEVDAYCRPKPLYTDDDYDAIPPGFSNSVKFLAAALAFMTSGRLTQAQMMEQEFASRLASGRVAADHGKTSQYYWSSF